jgi:hypothetical protein
VWANPAVPTRGTVVGVIVEGGSIPTRSDPNTGRQAHTPSLSGPSGVPVPAPLTIPIAPTEFPRRRSAAEIPDNTP